MDLKIIEKIEKPLKYFNSVEEFNIYLNKNKEQLDKETTQRLNKEYHIEGYRITKIKGEICLKKVINKETDDSAKDQHEIERLNNEVERLKIDLLKLGKIVNELVESFNAA